MLIYNIMAIVLPVILQNPFLITTLTTGITAISYGINKYILSDNSYNSDNSDNSDNIFKETTDIQTGEDFVNIINDCIPVPPNISEYLLKKESYLMDKYCKNCNIELKIKTRYKDFEHFKKCRNNRNKRKRQKLNRTNK
jgi:hypothetical protein